MTVTAPMSFSEAVEARRSYYNLTNKSSLSDAQLQELVEHAIKYTPSSYNSQTSRAVLVLGEKHRQLWDHIWAAHSPNLAGNPDLLKVFQDKFENAYKPGYGTVVFFEDQDAIDKFVEKNPMVSQVMPLWAATTNGMTQFQVWTDLAAHGIGANLQHYGQFGPANQTAITKFLGVPETWVNHALMPFGVPAGPPAIQKTFLPLEDRVKVVS